MISESWTVHYSPSLSSTLPPEQIVSKINSKCNDTISEDVSKFHFYGWPFVAPMAFILIVAILVTIFGNILVILTIWRHHGMRTRTNLFLANLALADILVGVLDMPFSVVTLIKGDWLFGTGLCQLNAFTNGLGLMTSTHTLMLISIHKYISITRPFSQVMSTGVISIMIGVAWLWSIIYNLAPFYGWTKVVYKEGATQCGPVMPCTKLERSHSYCNTLVNLITPIVVMIFCNVRIFRAVGQHLNRMRQTSNMDFRNTVLQQRRITVTLVIVIVCFFLCWTPYTVYSCMIALSKNHKWVPKILNPISYWCGYINSACNPIIYALRSPSFRQGYKEILFGRSEGVLTGSFNSGTLTKSFRYNSHPKRRFFKSRNNNVILKSHKPVVKSNGAHHQKIKTSQSSPNLLVTFPNGITVENQRNELLNIEDKAGKPWRSIQIPKISKIGDSIHGSLEEIRRQNHVKSSDEYLEMHVVTKSHDEVNLEETKQSEKLLGPELPLLTISRLTVNSDVGVEIEVPNESCTIPKSSDLETLSIALGGSLEKLHRQITQRRLRRHGAHDKQRGADIRDSKLLHPNDDATSRQSSRSLRSSLYALFRKSSDLFTGQAKSSDEPQTSVEPNTSE